MIVKMNFWIAVIMLFSGLLCTGVSNRLNYDRAHEQYAMAHERNYYNPLYMKGHIRKDKKYRKIFYVDLKGLYICQCITFVLACVTAVYCRLVDFSVIKKNWMIEDMIFIAYLVVVFLRMIVKQYYKMIYKEAFRYAENKNGVWTPFSYLVRPWNRGVRRSLDRPLKKYVETDYKKIYGRIMQRCSELRYDFDMKYLLSKEQEVFFWSQNHEVETIIVGLLHIKEYQEGCLKQWNDLFEEYWNLYIANNKKTEEVKFIIFICADHKNQELRKRFLSSGGIDQKEGRYRFLVFGVEEGGLAIYQPELYNKFCGKKEFQEMKAEFYKITGL